jgi:RNA polymerase sigma-70 factor, ECF subfamily
MSDLEAVKASLRDAHAQFAVAVESLRPALHRYCSRMTGSVLDGEDLVQETLAQACYGLTLLQEDVPLRPWLFTIAHHKCVDFLRRRSASPTVDVDVDAEDEPSVEIDVAIEVRDLASREFSRLVLTLPPRERAVAIFKEVLGYSLSEIATILETSLGAVKAALHRGREKLAASQDALSTRTDPPAAVSGYVEAFNRRDWTLLQSLVEAEVRCDLVGNVHHVGYEAIRNNYLSTYSQLPYGWRLVPGEVDDEPVILCLREKDGEWTARHAIRLEWRGERVMRIRDYAHVPDLFVEAHVSWRKDP